MENFVKLQSTQGIFDTSGNKNLVDFQLPANSGSYDLSQSFININVSINTSSTDAVDDDLNAPDPVYNVGLVINESDRGTANSFRNLITPDNAVLVKNARMLCAKGKVEDIRKVDCLRSNLALYKQSDDNQVRNTYGLSNWGDSDIMPKQPLNALHGTGVQDSEKRSHDIRIPISSIFEMGKSTVWDTTYYGHTKVNLELNLQKLAVLDKTTAVLADKTYLLRGATQKYTAMKDITSVAAATIGGSDFSLVSKIEYESIEDSPFYVGQRCDLVKTGGTGTLTNKVVQISKITHAINTTKQPLDGGGVLTHAGSIVIELTKSYGTLTAGQDFTGLTLTPKDLTTSPITINNIELVAKMSEESETQPTQYTTFVSQEDTAPVSSNISRTYSIPANATNCYVMFNNPIYSSEKLDSYRITLDGIDVTNREVKVGSALHYDLISQVFTNRGQAVGNLLEEMKNGLINRGGAGQVENMVIIMFPVKLKNAITQLGLELNATSGQTLSGKIIVYSEVVKEL